MSRARKKEGNEKRIRWKREKEFRGKRRSFLCLQMREKKAVRERKRKRERVRDRERERERERESERERERRSVIRTKSGRYKTQPARLQNPVALSEKPVI